MTKRIALSCVVAILALAGVAGAAGSDTSPLDQHWLNAAAQGDAYEVTVGKLAQRKGDSDGAKSFGSMLARDHAKSLRQTNGVAKALGVELETKPNPLQQQIIALLSRADGSQFDFLLAQIAVGDHRLDIKDALEEATLGQAAPVKRLARTSLPTLRKHLAMATRLAHSTSSSGLSTSG